MCDFEDDDEIAQTRPAPTLFWVVATVLVAMLLVTVVATAAERYVFTLEDTEPYRMPLSASEYGPSPPTTE